MRTRPGATRHPPARCCTRRHQTGRTVVELEVDEVGPSLKYATANVNKVSRSTSENGSPCGQGSNTGGGADPWGSRTPAADAEPPF